MKKKLKWAALVVSVLLCAYVGVAWYMSSQVIDFSVHTLEEARVYRKIDSLASLGFPESESVSVASGGVTLAGWLFRNPSGKRCGVVASHGHKGTRYASLRYAALFYQRGCHILAFDARHHGESRADFGTYGYYERHDLVRVVEVFAASTGLERHEIGVFGLSMGASVSLQAAALTPDMAFVVADSPYADFHSIMRRRGEAMYGGIIRVLMPGAMWLAELRSGADFDDVSPKQDASRITMPVLLIHSRTDEFTPPEHSQAIYDAIEHDRKELHFTDWGAAHVKSLETDPAGYQAILDGFLDRYAPGF